MKVQMPPDFSVIHKITSAEGSFSNRGPKSPDTEEFPCRYVNRAQAEAYMNTGFPVPLLAKAPLRIAK